MLALVGGAYAASRYLGAAASKSKPQIRRGPRGPRGETGPAGQPGAAGERGVPGLLGANGENVIARTVIPGNLHCETGGTKFRFPDGTTSFTCNGAEGARGKEGPAWPPNGTLPPGDVERGTWVAGPSDGETAQASISFPIPLPSYVTTTTYKCEETNLMGECISRYCPKRPNRGETPYEGFLCVYGLENFEHFLLSGALDPENNQPWEAGTTGGIIIPKPGEELEGVWIVTAGTKG